MMHRLTPRGLFCSLIVLYALFVLCNAQTTPVASNAKDVALPDAPANAKSVKSTSGYLRVRSGPKSVTAYLFYYFVEHEEPTKRATAPLMLWLNGGPGCSSLIGLFMENGPYRITADTNKPLVTNPYSWHKTANVLYIDNPLGAGFSYIENHTPPSTTAEAITDLFEALDEFFKLPNMGKYKSNPMYLFGESYAGKYALQFATVNLDKGRPFNLQGLGLGNTWVHPPQIEKAYPELAYLTGLFGYQELVQATGATAECIQRVNDFDYQNADVALCTPAFIDMLSSSGGFNSYDYRVLGEYSLLASLRAYLKRQDVTDALGTTGRSNFHQCSSQLFDLFEVEFQKPFHNLMPRVLENYRVMTYLGQFDVRCNVLSSLEWMRTVDWPGRAHMDSKSLSLFTDPTAVPVPVYGNLREVGNFSILVIYGSGHLSPMDQPAAALRMASIFTAGQSLCTSTANPENCTRLECPSKCSLHGSCNETTGMCLCNVGFSGPDCANASIPASVGETFEFEGYLFGKTLHEYRFRFKSKYNVFNTFIELTTTTPTGAIHMFATSATNPISIAYDDNQLQRTSKFMFTNQSDFAIKSLNIDSGTEGGLITLQLWNSVDEEAQYTMVVRPRTISAYMKVVIGLSFLLASTAVLVVILLIFFIFQQIRSGAFDTSKYSRLST